MHWLKQVTVNQLSWDIQTSFVSIGALKFGWRLVVVGSVRHIPATSTSRLDSRFERGL
jgi:hypothetical protein